MLEYETIYHTPTTHSVYSNEIVGLVNDIFRFKKEHMPEDSLLDVLMEYCYKNKFDTYSIGEKISEYEGFVELFEKDCIKHKYVRPEYISNEESIDEEWEC